MVPSSKPKNKTHSQTMLGAHQSTGPITPEGKSQSSKNALKHGLTVRRWLSADEKAYYEAVLTQLHGEYQPQTPTELLLVERLAISMSKLKRLTDVEDAQYQLARELKLQKLTAPLSPAERLIGSDRAGLSSDQLALRQAASLPENEVMNIINRQQNSLSRQISKELSELITIISIRKNITAIPNNSQP